MCASPFFLSSMLCHPFFPALYSPRGCFLSSCQRCMSFGVYLCVCVCVCVSACVFVLYWPLNFPWDHHFPTVDFDKTTCPPCICYSVWMCVCVLIERTCVFFFFFSNFEGDLKGTIFLVLPPASLQEDKPARGHPQGLNFRELQGV